MHRINKRPLLQVLFILKVVIFFICKKTRFSYSPGFFFFPFAFFLSVIIFYIACSIIMSTENSKGDCMECEEESGSCDGFLDCALEANKQEEIFMQNGHTKNVLSMFPPLFLHSVWMCWFWPEWRNCVSGTRESTIRALWVCRWMSMQWCDRGLFSDGHTQNIMS